MSEGTIAQSGHSAEALYNIFFADHSKREDGLVTPLCSCNAQLQKDEEGTDRCDSILADFFSFRLRRHLLDLSGCLLSRLL